MPKQHRVKQGEGLFLLLSGGKYRLFAKPVGADVLVRCN